MKRTNLVLDDVLLREATLALGEKTYSGAVNVALAEAVRARKVRAIGDFFGTNLWEGDLSTMREDRPIKSKTPVKR
jgi:Arc/MetJ family transcription regulator